MSKKSNQHNSGQTIVTLLIFMVVAITVTSAAVIMGIANSLASSNVEQGIVVLHIAESGAENAILRLLRNPNYQNETLPVGDGTAVITVTTNGSQKIIESEGRLGGFRKKVRVTLDTVDNATTVVSWREVF